MATYTYLEEQADLSPTQATFANQSQSCSVTYLFHNPTFDQLRSSVIDILGYTSARATDGRIQRILPARHPAYQWMFADSCAPQGVGIAHTVVAASPGPGSPLISGSVPLYGDYHYRVNFSPRPYNSWQDKDISVVSRKGYDKAGTEYDFSYATEWMRFTEFLLYPANQFITAQQGQMVFRADGPGGATQPNGISFQDAPKLYLPDSVLKVRWHQVPYRYLTSANSYLTKFIGHVNQNDFGYIAAGNQLVPYKKGSLLYLGANPTAVYTPPIPDEGLLAFNFGDGFVRGKLCDLELNFLYTARTIGTVTANTPDFAAVNRNWVVAGHNLLPWLTTRKFYYASTYDPADAANQAKWFPLYNSFPFELLFTDPDANNSPAMDP